MGGRMFAREQKHAAQAHYAGAVQIERADGGSSRWRQPDEVKVIGTPGKVFVPVVVARVKNGSELSGQRIERLRLVRLGTVAALTG